VNPIFTLGYEQSSVAEFLTRLKNGRIERVVDVRDLPLSRRTGFSKTPLSEHLDKAGIAYQHLRALGAPKPLRDAVRGGGSWQDYEKGYGQVLAENEEALRELLKLSARERICLVCFERDPERCHRRLVAEAMRSEIRGGPDVQHIRY